MAAPERFVVARDALLEITAESTVGELISETVADDGVVTMLFAATMAGYPGWHWTVSVAELPGEGALLAPDWVPWSERLEDYKEAQAAAVAAAGADDLDDEDSDDDDDDDLGDDPDDGIDFEDLSSEERTALEGALEDELEDELDVPAVGVEQADEPEGEADDAGPQPPDVAALDEWAEEQQ